MQKRILKRWSLAGLAGVLVLGGAEAEAQTVLNDGGSHVINTVSSDWYYVTNVGCSFYCWNPVFAPTHLTLDTGGVVTNDVEVFGTSTVTLSGGEAYGVSAWDHSSVTVTSGGNPVANLTLEQEASATISGGELGILRAYGTGSSSITGGEIQITEVADWHTVHMSGGESYAGASALDDATFIWSGGHLHETLNAGGNSDVRVVGADFQVDFQRVGYGVIPVSQGVLSGNLQDGNPHGFPDTILIASFKHNTTPPFTGSITLVAGSNDPDEDWLGPDAESNAGTNPNLYDTDGDGLGDGEELGVHGCSPLLADSDIDGFSDGVEVAAGSDPNDASSMPAASVPSLSGSGQTGLALLLCAAFLLARRTARS